MSVVVVISQHLLNVFVQLANKRGLKKILFRERNLRRIMERTESATERNTSLPDAC
jgi:hypothetical protein